MPHHQRPSRLPLLTAAAAATALAAALLVVVPNTATASEAPDPTATTTAPVETQTPVEPTQTPAPTETPAPTATPEPTTAPSPTTTTVTFLGDSITAMPGSWMRQMNDPTLTVVGGTAISGATTPRILRATAHQDADVLVVMAGTNDLRYGYTSAKILGDFDQMIATVGARHVVISAIAPSNITNYGKHHRDRRLAGEILNRDLQNYALTHGYLFVDPFAADRMLNGGWSWKRTTDGIHPNVAMSAKVAVRMQQAIHIAVNGANG